jgi:hypothetical protein
MASTKRRTPWETPDPKPPAKRRHLTPAQKSKAAARAGRAGRPYPNLADNMAVARTASKTSGAKSAGKKNAAKKKAGKKKTEKKAGKTARKKAAKKSGSSTAGQRAS